MTKWALIYVNESWLLQRELSSLLYNHSAEWTKWVLICVFVTYVNWSIYCVAQMCMCAKAESCLCNVYVCDVYELQHMCKDVAVVLCIWAKTVSCLCSVCICDACKSIRKSINQSIYCVTSMCICAKAELCLRNVYVCDVYELQHMHKDVAVVLYI